MNIEKYLRLTGFLRKGSYPDVKIPSPGEGEDIKAAPSTLFHFDDHCLVLGDAGFRERGMLLGGGFLVVVLAIIPCFIVSYFLIKDQAYWMVIGFFLAIVLGGHPFFLAAWFELTRSSVYPVVFNRKTGKVYFFSDQDGRPRQMPWQECSYAVAYKGRSIVACQYELRGFIMSGYSVEDSFSFGDTVYEFREASKNEVFYLFYYIQSFMKHDEEIEKPERLMSWRPSLAESAQHTIPRLVTNNTTVNVLSTVFYRSMCVFFSWQILGHYLICRYGKVPQWSQEIIDECGEKIIIK